MAGSCRKPCSDARDQISFKVAFGPDRCLQTDGVVKKGIGAVLEGMVGF